MNPRKAIAILITVFNRKEKTLACLRSIYEQEGLSDFDADIFIVDGGSKDGTPEAIKAEFPEVHVSIHNGLYWAGGMRQAWKEALAYRQDYDYFWLLNDDTTLCPTCLGHLMEAENVALEKYGRKGIYIGNTCDPHTGKLSYGAIDHDDKWVIPDDEHVRDIKLANANIMLVSREAYDKLGGFAAYCTHGIADYDYSLRAVEANIPLLASAHYCGTCENDHKATWLPQSTPLQKRIEYLYSPKGLAYKEYMIYIKRFFPNQVLKTRVLLWTKTLFPFIWEKFKNTSPEA